MKTPNQIFALCLLLANALGTSAAQGLTETTQSPFAVMHDVPMGQVHWTTGFWGNRFDTFHHHSVPGMWQTWQDSDLSHGLRNFEIAAGDCSGEHAGPPFHDGDMYKWLESVASVYAVTHDPQLDSIMDHFIDLVVRAQRADGYIHTPVIIDERNQGIDTHAHVTSQQIIGTKVGDANDKGAFAVMAKRSDTISHLDDSISRERIASSLRSSQ